jgi:hypothetical protein
MLQPIDHDTRDLVARERVESLRRDASRVPRGWFESVLRGRPATAEPPVVSMRRTPAPRRPSDAAVSR